MFVTNVAIKTVNEKCNANLHRYFKSLIKKSLYSLKQLLSKMNSSLFDKYFFPQFKFSTMQHESGTSSTRLEFDSEYK